MPETLRLTAYAAGADLNVVCRIDWVHEDVTVLSAEDDDTDVLASLSAADLSAIEAEAWAAYLDHCAAINAEQARHQSPRQRPLRRRH